MMVLHLKRFLVLFLLCLAPLAQADQQRLQALHELRSEGYTTGTYLLIDNNLFERVREPGNREEYNRALGNISRILQELGNPSELSTPFANFQSLIRELEAQGEDEAHYNLATVNRIMQAHGAFDLAAAEAYELAAVDMPPELLTLHKQSLETSQILMLYQNNMFSSVGVYFLENQEGLFEILDASLRARSAELKTLYPEQADTFARLDKQYDFIQPRLKNPLADWVPTIAAFYLQRNVLTLNNMAREAVRSGA